MKQVTFIFLIFSLITLTLAQEEVFRVKPGEVVVTWTVATITPCPPGIFGKEPCEFVGLLEIIQRIWNFYLYVAPFILTFLIILGGFYFLLITFKPDMRMKGWRYIKEAVIGYILLLVISAIFTFIRFIFGGPSF